MTECPQCGGGVWDNRENKKNPKAPDFKCKECGWVKWPAKNTQAVNVGTYDAPQKSSFDLNASEKAKLNSPDWNEIGKGKTRCAILCSVIEKEGLAVAMASLAKVDAATEYVMTGRKPGQPVSDDIVEVVDNADLEEEALGF